MVEFFFRLFAILWAWQYDLVILQKGIATINYRFFDFLLHAVQKNIIFDMDDAITIDSVSRLTRFPWNIFDDPAQTFRLSKWARKVFVGNERLRKDLLGVTDRVLVIPTPVDTRYYHFDEKRYERSGPIQVIWSGNKSAHYLLALSSAAIARLSQKYDIRLTVLSDVHTENLRTIFGAMPFDFMEWSYENEKKLFERADIGIMPLTDTLWNRRKCAFKGLLYMANGIPGVSSPVGVVNEFIEDGKNGFLADSDAEWYDKLERLVRDKKLRKSVGLSGHKTLEQKFSLAKWGPCWNEAIKIG
ncbi:MAG: glycosyltransferase [Patescibacteria group bacterium]|jgi:glycosyltransferase involved in cell wall biosynthesis